MKKDLKECPAAKDPKAHPDQKVAKDLPDPMETMETMETMEHSPECPARLDPPDPLAHQDSPEIKAQLDLAENWDLSGNSKNIFKILNLNY